MELSRIFPEFQKNFSGGVVKTALYESTRTILGKIFLFEKDAFFVNLGHWKKNSRLFFQFYSTQLSKLHSKCPKDHLGGKYSFWETTFYHQFRRFALTFKQICWNFLGRVIISAPFVSKQTVSDKRFSEKILFCRSGNLREKNSVFCRKKSVGLSKLKFTSPVEHSQEKCKVLETATFLMKEILNFFSIISTH